MYYSIVILWVRGHWDAQSQLPPDHWLAIVGYNRDPRQACPWPDLAAVVGKPAHPNNPWGRHAASSPQARPWGSFVETLLPQPGNLTVIHWMCVCVCVDHHDHHVRKGFGTGRMDHQGAIQYVLAA